MMVTNRPQLPGRCAPQRALFWALLWLLTPLGALCLPAAIGLAQAEPSPQAQPAERKAKGAKARRGARRQAPPAEADAPADTGDTAAVGYGLLEGAEGTQAAEADPPALPDDVAPYLELITIGPTDDLFTLYGHAAMRVVEAAELRADGQPPAHAGRLFNFGITHFREPGYMERFARGTVRFWGDAGSYARDVRRWARRDRSITRYPLRLSPAQRRCVVDRMTRDIEPEHREFVYDTFRDNCATRLRDLLDECTGGAIFGVLGEAPGERRFRDDVRFAYSGEPALLFFSDLIPGRHFDQPRSQWALAYRPEALAQGLSQVLIQTAAGLHPILGDAIVEHARQSADPRTGRTQRAEILLYLLSGLCTLLALFAWRLPVRMRAGLLLPLVLFGALHGALLWWLSVGTAWPDMRAPTLLLYFMPFDLVLLWPALTLLIRGRPSAQLGLFRFWVILRGAGVLAVFLAGLWWAPLAVPLSAALLVGSALAFTFSSLHHSAEPSHLTPERGHI